MKTKAKAIRIRPASREDYGIIEAVHRTAFSVSEFGYNGEAELSRLLHEDGDALVSLLAVADDDIVVGHALFSRTRTEGDGKPIIATVLAPTGVVPMWKNKGVGAALIKAGLAALKPMGVQMCFAVGHPSYYQRVGFSLETAQPFASPYGGRYFMGVKLDDNLQLPKAGSVEFAPAFAGF